jgi:hypothetical protein
MKSERLVLADESTPSHVPAAPFDFAREASEGLYDPFPAICGPVRACAVDPARLSWCARDRSGRAIWFQPERRRIAAWSRVLSYFRTGLSAAILDARGLAAAHASTPFVN